ncbi:MAG TPA: HEAT repeat domain-containing protein, partial [Polyangiaceae bacterium]|nr:HEAT repeat domain-containing protein [Polyangiaceae bacterium]
GVASAHGPTPSNGSAPASGERRTANAAGAISQPAAPRDSGQRLAQRAAGPSVAPPQSGTARAGGLAPQPAANGTSSAASARDAVSPSTAPGSADGTRAPTSGAKTPSAAPSAPWRPAAWLPASRPPASEHAPPSRPAAPTAHSEASAGPASSATHDLARPPEPAAVERPAIFPPPPTDSAIEELVESICQGDLRAAQELARIGAPSLPQVMARFPGPVVSERPSSRASECGPLLRALATIGSPAMPSITQRSEDPDARVRRWATLLLGEMPSAEACRAVVRRLADDVPRVHQAALDAARLLLAGPAAEAFRDTLFEVAKADDSPLTLRLRTLEHVAKLKDSASVPRLIAFLAADLEPVVHKALWALTVVTRRDHGRDASAWTDFWEQNRGRHRVEWLIDALDPGDPRASRAAAEDLREEAGELFGYNDEQSPEERREVQQKFRTWWQTGAVRRRPSFP